jgi:cytochrome c556
MREKLDATQRLLQAIVTVDYAGMTKHSDALGRISEAEIASWQRVAEAEYTKHATAFLLSVNGLRDAAAAKDVDTAAAEYTTLVSICLGCHKYIRRFRPGRP